MDLEFMAELQNNSYTVKSEKSPKRATMKNVIIKLLFLDKNKAKLELN